MVRGAWNAAAGSSRVMKFFNFRCGLQAHEDTNGRQQRVWEAGAVSELWRMSSHEWLLREDFEEFSSGLRPDIYGPDDIHEYSIKSPENNEPCAPSRSSAGLLCAVRPS